MKIFLAVGMNCQARGQDYGTLQIFDNAWVLAWGRFFHYLASSKHKDYILINLGGHGRIQKKGSTWNQEVKQ